MNFYSAFAKAFNHVLKNSNYNKDIEKNSLILRLDDLANNLVCGLMDLYSKYNNPYIEREEDIEIYTDELINGNLYIFDDIVRDEVSTENQPSERMIDFFDNNWEDYVYEDANPHFYYKKSNLYGINAGFFIGIGKSIFYDFQKGTNIGFIMEEPNDNKGNIDIRLAYKSRIIDVLSISLDNNDKEDRRTQILTILKFIINIIIHTLKAYELTILEIRKENHDYTFNCDDTNFYNRLEKYVSNNLENSRIDWINDENKNIINSKYIHLVQGLQSYFYNTNPEIFREISKSNNDIFTTLVNNIDQWLDSVVNSIESISCTYNNKTTTLVVPQDIKNSIRTIMSYKYDDNNHYNFNIGSTELFNENDEFVMHFPVVVLLDKENNVVDKENIKDDNILKCYDKITEWLKSELNSFGIPIDAITAGIDNMKAVSSQALANINKNNIRNNGRANVIVVDRSVSADDVDIDNLVEAITNAINMNSDDNIEDLSFDSQTTSDSNNKENSINITPRSNNGIVKNNKKEIRNKVNNFVEFNNPIQYSEYIEEKLLPYIKSIYIQFYMHPGHLKQISKLFKEYADMSEAEYYNRKNIFNDISFNDFFQGDSFIVNINYRNILLDSMLVYYGEENEDRFYIGRIFDKINYSVPRTKEWFRQCSKYNANNGLNLSLCSYAGIANIDLTGLAKYVFDDKFNRELFANAVDITSDKRCNDSRVFEISSYIWSIMSTIFMKKYIKDSKYNGEEQYEEFEYVKSIRDYNMSNLITAYEDFILGNYLDKNPLILSKYMIESYLNDNNIFEEPDPDIIDELDDSFVHVALPDGVRLYCYEYRTHPDNTIDYESKDNKFYIVKPRIKSLNRDFNVKFNTTDKFEFWATKWYDEKEGDYKDLKLLLIQNIKDHNKFNEDILKVLKYIEFSYDSIASEN